MFRRPVGVNNRVEWPFTGQPFAKTTPNHNVKMRLNPAILTRLAAANPTLIFAEMIISLPNGTEID